MNFQSSILILADGARFDVFESLLAEGKLPQIEKHVISRGAYSRMVSTFTSTTGPAYVPFLTGCYPGTVNMPGIRWFDKQAFGRSSFLNPHRFRSYCGWEVVFMNSDLRPDKPTIFELFDRPLNIFNSLNRGVRSQSGWLEKISIAREKRRKNYENLDALATRLFEERFTDRNDFTFVVLQSIDGLSHVLDPNHPRVMEGYRRLDTFVGKVAGRLKDRGTYDRTLIGICSDHGLTSTQTHFDLAPWMEGEHGLRTLAYTNIFKMRPEVSVQVSGNAMAHVYFKNKSWLMPCYADDIDRLAPGLRDALTVHPSVCFVITKASAHEIEVRTDEGSVLLSEQNGTVRYTVQNKDPFGYDPMPAEMSEYDALEKTWETAYPDALVQILQLFRTSRTGDMIVVSNLGHDLREKWENPEHKSSHGSLHREHMMVPFCLSHPFQAGPIRSVDVFPTYLTLLGKPLPSSIDGKLLPGLST